MADVKINGKTYENVSAVNLPLADGSGFATFGGAYDRFWDAFQQNGSRTNYQYGFGGSGWNAESFRPKYSIVPTNAGQMFAYATNLNVSMPEHLALLGVDLDFSKTTSFSEAFLFSTIKELGVVDTRSAAYLTYAFRYAQSLKTIQNLILKDDGSQTFAANTFQYASALENLTITGVIGTSGIDVSTCNALTHDSLMNIVNALKDYSGSGSAHTIVFGSTNKAKLTSAELDVATNKGWTVS